MEPQWTWMDLMKCTLPAGLRHDVGYRYVVSVLDLAGISVAILVSTVASWYPRTLVRYAGTCIFASLEWGRWPGARFPLPKTWGFLVLAVAASPARQSARPSLSQSVPTLAGSLGDCDCSDTVKRTQSIHPFHPTVTTVTQSRRKRNRFGALEPPESRSQRFSLGVLFSVFGVF